MPLAATVALVGATMRARVASVPHGAGVAVGVGVGDAVVPVDRSHDRIFAYFLGEQLQVFIVGVSGNCSSQLRRDRLGPLLLPVDKVVLTRILAQ